MYLKEIYHLEPDLIPVILRLPSKTTLLTATNFLEFQAFQIHHFNPPYLFYFFFLHFTPSASHQQPSPLPYHPTLRSTF
jgi:hypothetical protein